MLKMEPAQTVQHVGKGLWELGVIWSLMSLNSCSLLGEYFTSLQISKVFQGHPHNFAPFDGVTRCHVHRVTVTVCVDCLWFQLLKLSSNSIPHTTHVTCTIIALIASLCYWKIHSSKCILNCWDSWGCLDVCKNSSWKCSVSSTQQKTTTSCKFYAKEGYIS